MRLLAALFGGPAVDVTHTRKINDTATTTDMALLNDSCKRRLRPNGIVQLSFQAQLTRYWMAPLCFALQGNLSSDKGARSCQLQHGEGGWQIGAPALAREQTRLPTLQRHLPLALQPRRARAHGARAAQGPRVCPLRRRVRVSEQPDEARARGAREAQGPRVPLRLRRCVCWGVRPKDARAHGAREAQGPRVPPLRRCVYAEERPDDARAHGAREAQGPHMPPLRVRVRAGGRPEEARARGAREAQGPRVPRDVGTIDTATHPARSKSPRCCTESACGIRDPIRHVQSSHII
jgi:hypothetical protein